MVLYNKNKIFKFMLFDKSYYNLFILNWFHIKLLTFCFIKKEGTLYLYLL